MKEPEGRRDDEAEEGGRRSEQEEVDDFDGATEEILQSAPVFGEGFVVTAFEKESLIKALELIDHNGSKTNSPHMVGADCLL